MVNIKEKANTLIKKNNLVKLMRKKGIRVNQDSLSSLTKNIELYTFGLLEQIEEKLTIKGRKTLKKKDIEEVLEKQNERDYPEI